MGLREKVALIAVIISIQVVFVICSPKIKILKGGYSQQHPRRGLTATYPSTPKKVQSPKIRYKKSFNKNQEEIRRKFHFPDVEYPIASTPRPPFLQKPTDNSQITPQYSFNSNNRNDIKNKNKKIKNLTKFKSTIPEKTNVFPEMIVTSKPYFHEEQGIFPEVEYPLNIWETWKPNYWYGSSYGLKNNINNGPNRYTDHLSKVPIPSAAIEDPAMSKRSHNVKATPPPTQVNITKTTPPFAYTPYTTLYFDTTPPTIQKATDDNKSTTVATKGKKTEKKKNKSTKKDMSVTVTEKTSPIVNDYVTSTPYHVLTTILPEEELQITKTHDTSFVTLRTELPISHEDFNKLDTCSILCNETLSYMYVATTTPSHLSCNDPTYISLYDIHNDDKIPTAPSDNKVASISDVVNAVASENSDNKDSCLDDNAKNSNKSSTFEVEEEFTTDVFPDFDENILPWNTMSTSTMSPLTLVDTDDWKNSAIIDPYKSVAYIDELEQCYIAVP